MTARQRILDYLASRESASAAEVARAMHCSAANARHHLGILLNEGLITIAALRQGSNPTQKGRPGRPVQLYTLAQPAARHNLNVLAAAALDMLLASTPLEQQQFLLRGLATRMADPLPTTRSLTLRLSVTIQRLNDMGYHARWEAHAAGPRIIFGHCPYAAILPHYPILCSLDVSILAALLNDQVTQLVRLEPSPSGIPFCLFQVG
jgi:predicted ArsR family transcriptional regulator